MRHNIGLGAFGGWSEPLQPQTLEAHGPMQSWCNSGLGEVSQPPGTRSPPDGQNDDSLQSATCSQLPTTLPFQSMSLSPQPQQLQAQQQHGANSLENLDPMSQARLPQVGSQALWPVMAASSHNSYSQYSVPEVQPDPASHGFGCVPAISSAANQRLPALSPEYDNPDQQERGGAIGECSGTDEGDSGSGLINKNTPFRGLDVIASRPLDVVPSNMPSDQRLVGGHEGRHPDIIDVWQSGTENITSAAAPTPQSREDTPPPVAENIECSGADVPAHSPELHNRIDDDESNQEQAEPRLLPDLMSMNIVDNSPSEGANAAGEYPDPAIVMENALSNVNMNDPAIVVESQSCSRIPEVVNVHQTAENQNPVDVVASIARSISPSISHEAEHHLSNSNHPPVVEDTPGILQDHVTPVCDNPASETGDDRLNTSRIDFRMPPHSALPDVSDVNPAPLSFHKDDEMDDAELDAELAELEEEQFRLQGAYGGSLSRSLSGGSDNLKVNDSTHSLDSSMREGPDLIGGMSASLPRSDDDENNAASNAADTSDDINSRFCQWQQRVVEVDSMGSPERSTLETHENPEFAQYEVSGVEEVICKPQNNDTLTHSSGETKNSMESANLEKKVLVESESISSKSNDGDNGDNISNASTGTDTMSSSSTLTDGDMGSPDRRAQLPPVTVEPESPSRVTPGTLVTAVYDDDSGSGREDECTEAVVGEEGATGLPTGSSGSVVGQVAPFWIPDEEAPNCQECGQKFTVIRRRHHCRACGRVLCAQCCHHKAPLPYMEYKEARVCGPCLQLIQLEEEEDAGERTSNQYY
ncbi:hypothetical protein SK128_015054 [Halocaridina rubra]|uniref:FYVE-type domain-containing protein n=1 Tax=Halocaridina rubra TaxID=373956 RepID=A0AAN8WWI3_HALRR